MAGEGRRGCPARGGQKKSLSLCASPLYAVEAGQGMWVVSERFWWDRVGQRKMEEPCAVTERVPVRPVGAGELVPTTFDNFDVVVVAGVVGSAGKMKCGRCVCSHAGGSRGAL